MSETALLEAIYAAPDDDAPRRVLADWLLERGDAWGHFINAQLDRDDATARKHLHAAIARCPFPRLPIPSRGSIAGSSRRSR